MGRILTMDRGRRQGRARCRAGSSRSAEMLPEKLRRPAPGELGGFAVVHGLALLVDESVLGIIAEQLERLAGGLHAVFKGIDQLRRAPVVLVGEMGLERDLDVGGLGRLLWRDAVEHDAGRKLRNLGFSYNDTAATETEAC